MNAGNTIKLCETRSRRISMKSFISALSIILLQIALSTSAVAQGSACNTMTVGQLTSLNGFVPFPMDNLWNADISAAPVDPNSTNIINYIGGAVTLHPDFGSGTYNGQTIGIPYQVVAGTQNKVTIELGAYASESDPGPMPVTKTALIEGYPKPGSGDRHVLALEKDGCWLYELYHAYLLKNGNWSADSTANYNVISPAVGPVRGTAIVVNPKSTTTYTLYSTNQYGRTKASVTVAVH
jgi:hypothetical protein